jgi:hypothetical protein
MGVFDPFTDFLPATYVTPSSRCSADGHGSRSKNPDWQGAGTGALTAIYNCS